MKNQKGAMTIIEAAFVFPIMFFVVFIMLMACEAYYQYARVEKACIVAAIQGAAQCENPMLEAVLDKGAVPTSPSAVKVRPYRYILTSEAKSIAAEVGSNLQKTIDSYEALAFKGMRPSNVQVNIQPKMNILISSFPVECSFDVKLPIRMIFSNQDLTFKYSIGITEPIGDPAEFVRNVSTVQDYMERSEKIQKITGEITKAMQKLAKYTN